MNTCKNLLITNLCLGSRGITTESSGKTWPYKRPCGWEVCHLAAAYPNCRFGFGFLLILVFFICYCILFLAWVGWSERRSILWPLRPLGQCPVNSFLLTKKELLGSWMAVPRWTYSILFGRPPLWVKKVKPNHLSRLNSMLFDPVFEFLPTHGWWLMAWP